MDAAAQRRSEVRQAGAGVPVEGAGTRGGWTAVGLLIVLALALVLRLAAHAEMARAVDTFAPVIDSEAYLLAALRVSDGRDVADGVYFQAPLYPLLLGAAFRTGGMTGGADGASAAGLDPEFLTSALRIGRLLNLLLGLAAVALVWRVGQVLYSPRVGLAAGLLAASYGPFMFYEGHLLKVSLSLLFLPWAVLAAARGARRASALSFVWCGIALALGGLVQGHMQPLAPAAALLLLLRPPSGTSRAFGLRAAVAVLGGAFAVAAPVIARNSIVSGGLVLSTAQGGAAFFLCNNPANPRGIAEHSTRIRQVPRHERDDFHAETERLTGRAMTAAEISSYWTAESLGWIRAEPGAWLGTELRKLLALTSRHESADNSGYFLGAEVSPVLAATPVRFGLVLPLALAGGVLLLLGRGRRPAWMGARPRHSNGGAATGRAALGLATVAYAGVVLIFCVTARYRIPVVPLLIVYAGVLLAGLGEILGRGRGVVLAVVLLVGWALTLAAETSFGPFDGEELQRQRAVRYRNRGLVAFGRGELGAARRDFTAALSAHPGAIRVFLDLARLAWVEGRGDEAREHLQRAVALGSRDGPTWADLGLLAYELGEDRLAADALGRALELHPGDRSTTQYLVLALLAQPDDPVRLAQAEARARQLVNGDPGHDDGWGLLTLSLARAGQADAARAALARYDELAAAREAAGEMRRLPDQPDFVSLRETP